MVSHFWATLSYRNSDFKKSDTMIKTQVTFTTIFYPVSFQAVEFMRQGKSPTEAASLALEKIAKYYPKYNGGLVAVNKQGEFG